MKRIGVIAVACLVILITAAFTVRPAVKGHEGIEVRQVLLSLGPLDSSANGRGERVTVQISCQRVRASSNGNRDRVIAGGGPLVLRSGSSDTGHLLTH